MFSKIIGSVLVFGASSAIGWYAAERIRERNAALIQLKQDLMMLTGEIRFAKSTLPEAIARLACHEESSFAEFFRGVSEELLEYSGASLKEIWCGQCECLKTDTALTARDIAFVASLGEILGMADLELQQNLIELSVERLSEEIKIAAAKEKDRVYLLRALGVLGGVFLTVLLL